MDSQCESLSKIQKRKQFTTQTHYPFSTQECESLSKIQKRKQFTTPSWE